MQERLHDVRAERRDHRDRYSVSNNEWPRSVEKCTILLTQFDDVCLSPSDLRGAGEGARGETLSVTIRIRKRENAIFLFSVRMLVGQAMCAIEILQRQPFRSRNSCDFVVDDTRHSTNRSGATRANIAGCSLYCAYYILSHCKYAHSQSFSMSGRERATRSPPPTSITHSHTTSAAR